jgi:hypothetical protein
MSAQDNVRDFEPRPDYKKEIRRIAGLDSAAERDMEMHELKDKLHKIGKNCRIEDIRADVDELIKTLKDAKRAEQRKAAGLGSAAFICDDGGNIIPNMANVITLLDTHVAVKDMIYWDSWRGCPMVMHPLSHPEIHELLVYGDDAKREFPRRFSDNDYLELLEWTQHQPGFEYVNLAVLKQAVDSRMKQTQRNPVVEWLNSLTWDRKPRVDEMLVDYFGMTPGPYALEVSRVMVMSIVKRIISPGCQQDYSPQLIQKQGCKKSEACRRLAIKDEFYTDCLHDLVSRDSAMLSMGMIIVELPEHVAATKHDANTSKAALTRRSNKFVQKYEKYATEVPRCHNFISSSNDPENLADPTGNRRWMPVDVCETCAQIDTDGLAAALPQIYAEALARLNACENYWPSDEFQKQYMVEKQEERRIVHNFEPIFEDYMRRVTGFNGDVLATKGIGIPTEALASFFSNCERIGERVASTRWKPMLANKGWGDKARAHRLVKNGPQARRYSKEGSDDILIGELEWHPRLNEKAGYWSYNPSWGSMTGAQKVVALEDILEGARRQGKKELEELEAELETAREAARKEAEVETARKAEEG